MPIRRKRKKAPVEQMALPVETHADRTVAAFLGHTGVSRSKRDRLPLIDQYLEDAKQRAQSGEWSGANGTTWIGLYVLCFQMVYGQRPIDLDKPMMAFLSRAGTGALRSHFKDNTGELVEYVKWVWDREKRRGEWAKKNGIEHRIFGARLQFAPVMIQDYMMNRQFKRERRGR